MANVVRPWPVEDLESIGQCPVCGYVERELLFEGVTDRVFCIADGSWNLYRCKSCRSGYLDPRPSRASIGRAYSGYFTHTVEDHSIVRRRGRLRAFVHDLINGYQNSRYGLCRSPSLSIGRWLLPLLPPLRAAADVECRHLPPLPKKGGRLLDVGCGNGAFLVLAKQAGWDVEGLDFDPEAVKAARSRGLDVQHGGIEALVGHDARYDLITLGHVIEHVHEPMAVLHGVHKLLKPGGTLWLETPNLSSFGLQRFGASWQTLDSPRHLTLFTPDGLKECFRKAGFTAFKQYWHGMSLFGIYAASEAIQRGESAIDASHGGTPPIGDVLAELYEMLSPGRREFLTFTARK